MSVLIMIFAAILVLGPLVALHEFGHFWVARKLGVKVLTYSIGFGPALFERKGKDGVDYRIAAIPLGGYVRMLDEREGEVDEAEKHLAFNNQKPWKKILIVAAGPVMNFIIAILLFWVLLLPASEQLSTKIGKILPDSPAATAGLVMGDKVIKVGDTPVNSWKDANFALVNYIGETTNIPVSIQRDNQQLTKQVPVTTFLKDQSKDAFEQIGFLPYRPVIKTVVHKIADKSAAQNQGLQVGDHILRINGKKADVWDAMSPIVRANPEKLLVFDVKRGDKVIQLKIMPQAKRDNQGNTFGLLGISPNTANIKIPSEYKQTIQYNPAEAFIKSIEQTWDLSVMTVSAMGKMITGLIGLDNLSGPITIAKVAGESLDIGWKALLSFMALISVSLGVLNLLPIPVLDGGHLVYYTYEAIRGKPLPENVQIIGLNIGLVIMLCFMVIAIGNDISRLF